MPILLNNPTYDKLEAAGSASIFEEGSNKTRIEEQHPEIFEVLRRIANDTSYGDSSY